MRREEKLEGRESAGLDHCFPAVASFPPSLKRQNTPASSNLRNLPPEKSLPSGLTLAENP